MRRDRAHAEAVARCLMEGNSAFVIASGHGDDFDVGGAIHRNVAFEVGTHCRRRFDGQHTPAWCDPIRGRQRITANIRANIDEHAARPQPVTDQAKLERLVLTVNEQLESKRGADLRDQEAMPEPVSNKDIAASARGAENRTRQTRLAPRLDGRTRSARAMATPWITGWLFQRFATLN